VLIEPCPHLGRGRPHSAAGGRAASPTAARTARMPKEGERGSSASRVEPWPHGTCDGLTSATAQRSSATGQLRQHGPIASAHLLDPLDELLGQGGGASATGHTSACRLVGPSRRRAVAPSRRRAVAQSARGTVTPPRPSRLPPPRPRHLGQLDSLTTSGRAPRTRSIGPPEARPTARPPRPRHGHLGPRHGTDTSRASSAPRRAARLARACSACSCLVPRSRPCGGVCGTRAAAGATGRGDRGRVRERAPRPPGVGTEPHRAEQATSARARRAARGPLGRLGRLLGARPPRRAARSSSVPLVRSTRGARAIPAPPPRCPRAPFPAPRP